MPSSHLTAQFTHPIEVDAAVAGSSRPVRTLVLVSCKGGAGKSVLATNLAVALQHRNKQVLLVDTDWGLASIDQLLGLAPNATLADVVASRCSLTNVLLEGPHGLLVAPAPLGLTSMTQLSPQRCLGLMHAFSELPHELDLMLVDTATGLSQLLLLLSQAAHEVCIIVSDEPSSITKATALIGTLCQHAVHHVYCIANAVADAQAGQTLYTELSHRCQPFERTACLSYLGFVPFDEMLQLAIQRQQPVVTLYPSSASARSIDAIAQRISRWQPPNRSRGELEFFIERMISTTKVRA